MLGYNRAIAARTHLPLTSRRRHPPRHRYLSACEVRRESGARMFHTAHGFTSQRTQAVARRTRVKVAGGSPENDM